MEMGKLACSDLQTLTHMANLFLSKINNIDEEKIWQILDEDPEIDGGVTHLTTGDLVLRIFGYRAQKLQGVAEKIKKIYERKKS